MRRRRRREQTVVGWREWVALPELRLPAVKAKVDSGARTSALHAWDIEPFERDGVAMVRFVVHPFQGDVSTTIAAEAPLLGRRTVRASSGHASRRPVIVTRLRLGEEAWPIELTLVRRDLMGFRMLLGRQAVRGRFVIDPGRSFLRSHPPDSEENPSP